MKLTTAMRHDKRSIYRIVAANVVSEQSLPFNLNPCDSPEKSYDLWQAVIASQPDHEPDKENLVVVIVNTRLVPFAWHRVSLGTVSEAQGHPREILRPVIASAGFGFILMHNHPSGDPSPSRADEAVTRRLSEASDLMQVRFIEHVIVGRPSPGSTGYFSFREAGLIP